MEAFIASCTVEYRLSSRVVDVLNKGSPEAVHDLRVAARQLRNALSLFKNFYPKRPQKNARRKLKKLMKVAGEVRDRCVAAQTLALSPGIDASDLVLDIRSELAVLKKKLDRLLRKNTKFADASAYRPAIRALRPQSPRCSITLLQSKRMLGPFYLLSPTWFWSA
jgi:CHAD domain-containing protein